MENKNLELIEVVKELINSGCNYQIEKLEKLYSEDLEIIMVQEDGTVMSFDYNENLDFFKNLKDAGAPPISTEVFFNYSKEYNGTGYVVATRKMDLGKGLKKIIFNLMLKKNSAGKWQIYREHAVIVGDSEKQ